MPTYQVIIQITAQNERLVRELINQGFGPAVALSSAVSITEKQARDPITERAEFVDQFRRKDGDV